MTKDEALRLALEASEELQNAIYNIGGEHVIDLNFAIEQADVSEFAITAIKAALEANDEPVPVAIVEVFGKDWRLDYMALPVGKHKLYAQQYTYTTPPQRKPLTDEEIWEALRGIDCTRPMLITRAIERAHGIKEETK